MKLRTKIITSTLLIVLLIITGSYLVIQDIQTGIIEGEFRDKGFLLANHLALEVATPLLVNDLVEIRNAVEDTKNSNPEIEYVFVTDSEGIVLYDTFEKGFPKALLNRSKPSHANTEYVFNTDRGIIHEYDAPLFKNVGHVHVGVSENKVRAQILEASRKLLLLATSAIILGGVFAYFIGRRLTEPIMSLTEGANRINKGILDQKINIREGDELGELAQTFNNMASSLNQKIKELVTSKERTEAAEKYLETLFNSIEDGIVVINTNHEIIKSNKSFLRIVNLSEEVVIGKTCHEIVFRSRPSGKCPLDEAIRDKKPVSIEHEASINGSKKILEIDSSLFLDRKGTMNIILVVRDVTQQKLLEEEIVTRNRELTVLNEISRNISESFDLNKILVKSYESLLKFTGMERGEVYLFDERSGNFKVYLGEGKNSQSREVLLLNGAKKKGEEISFVSISLKSKDKVLGIITLRSRKLHSFSESNKELFNSIGNQIGVAIENITFYNNIKYLKEFNEEILNNVNLAIHVVDKDMNILAVNNELIKFEKHFRKEQIINKNLFEVFPVLKEKCIDKEYEHVMKTGELFLSEEAMEYGGDTIHTSTSKIPIKDEKGNVEKIITVIKDISDQKRLEEELRDSYDELKLTYSKLQELFKIKDNFLSNVSHELRTPLTSILGFTELLLEENVTEGQKHKLEIILRNSKRLSGLIKSLLDTTLIESKNLQLNFQTVSLYELASQVAEDMNTIASIKSLPIYIEIPGKLKVEGDRERLVQVFSNIVDNAIKFTIAGEIRIKAEEEDKYVHIKISDTGIGIPEDKLERIFDRLYQADSSNTRKYSGTGLGLWISKNIVEAHGGKIWAESKNIGSTFHVLLPKPVKE